MKKTFFPMLTFLCIVLVAPAGYSDTADRLTEGNELKKYSQQLIDKGQMLQTYKGRDKVWMVDQGHQLLKAGMHIIGNGEMMYTDEGRSNSQRVGGALKSGGSLLLKMGRKQDPLTEQDKKKIVKEGKTMMGIGKLMLEEAKRMAP